MGIDTESSNVVFISFFTDEGNYPALAVKLIESLNRFGLTHDVRKIQPFSSWQEGVAYKPSFILDRLITHRKSIVWLDIDTEIWRYPELLFGDHDFAIYNWLADHHHHLDGKVEYNPNAESLLCAGGVQKYGYSAPAIDLVIRWLSLTNNLVEKKNNDPVLDQAFNNFSPPVKSLWLPKTYNRMDKHTHHWSSIASDSVVINHDYTAGAHKQARS